MTKSPKPQPPAVPDSASNLALFEELFILTIDEEDGSLLPACAERLGYGLSGALLAELALQGKLSVGESHRVAAMDAEPTGDALLDETLELIRAAEQPRKVGYWVRHLNSDAKRNRQRLIERLVSAGVLQQDDNQLLWSNLNQDHVSAKFALKQRLRQAMLTNAEPTLRDLALLSLARGCKMLNLIFTKDERKLVRRRIYELLVEKALKEPLAQSIQEIELAVETQLSAA